MAHEVESMMYVGQTPWHGLGTKLEGAPSISEAITAAGLDWSVNTEPLFLQDGTEVAGGFATVRSTDRSVLGVVGARYRPLQNRDAFDWFQPFLDSGEVTIHTAGSLRHGQRVWVLAQIGSEPMDIGGDPVNRFILLSNSHDGTTAIRAGFTPIRVVCANTLGMAHYSKKSQLLKVRHSKRSSLMLSTIRDTMNVVKQEFEATAEQYRILACRDVCAADLRKYVKTLLEVESVADVDLPTVTANMIEDIIGRMDAPAQAELKASRGTWWGAYNSYTEYLNHSRGRSADNRLSTLWFGTGVEENARALNLAMTLSA